MIKLCFAPDVKLRERKQLTITHMAVFMVIFIFDHHQLGPAVAIEFTPLHILRRRSRT